MTKDKQHLEKLFNKYSKRVEDLKSRDALDKEPNHDLSLWFAEYCLEGVKQKLEGLER